MHCSVEGGYAAKCSKDYLQHAIFVLSLKAAAPPCIEIVQSILNLGQILIFEILAHHDLEFEALQLAGHVYKGKDFKDAPQTGQIGRATEHDELAATAEEDG